MAEAGVDDSRPAVGVLGPGAIGGYVAALLEGAGCEVVCVGSQRSVAAIAQGGLHVWSARHGELTTRPAATTALDRPVDLLFVAVKAPALHAALDRVAPDLVASALVVPLLNGFEHLALLRERLGAATAAATIGAIEAIAPAPGEVRHLSTGPAQVELAADDPATRERLPAVAALLEEAGIGATIRATEAEAIWGKLVRLGAVACTTAASGLPVGAVRSDPEWRAQLEACVAEAAAVAAAQGAPVDAAAVMEQIDRLPETLTSSTARDVAAGRESELDAIAGSIVRAGARHGLDCPTIARLIAAVGRRGGQPNGG